MSHAKSGESVGSLDSKPRWGSLIALLTVVLLFIFVTRQISPPDWVDVTVGPLPEGTEDFCLVVEDSGDIGVLSWYHAKVTPFTTDPFMNGMLQGGYYDFDNDGFITASVKWREASRYGVLSQRRDGEWRLWWLETEEMSGPSPMRSIAGGGKAEVHMPDEARAQVPSKQLLKRLGITD